MLEKQLQSSGIDHRIGELSPPRGPTQTLEDETATFGFGLGILRLVKCIPT